MFCPYNLKTIVQVNQNRYEYNEAGMNTYHEHKLIENRSLMRCQKENCAAWYKGRCRYASVNLENE